LIIDNSAMGVLGKPIYAMPTSKIISKNYHSPYKWRVLKSKGKFYKMNYLHFYKKIVIYNITND
jgi:hypothetical protein